VGERHCGCCVGYVEMSGGEWMMMLRGRLRVMSSHVVELGEVRFPAGVPIIVG